MCVTLNQASITCSLTSRYSTNLTKTCRVLKNIGLPTHILPVFTSCRLLKPKCQGYGWKIVTQP